MNMKGSWVNTRVKLVNMKLMSVHKKMGKLMNRKGSWVNRRVKLEKSVNRMVN